MTRLIRTDTPLIRTLSMAPSASVITGFDSIVNSSHRLFFGVGKVVGFVQCDKDLVSGYCNTNKM